MGYRGYFNFFFTKIILLRWETKVSFKVGD